MEIDVFTQLVSTVGFPICCVLFMGLFIYKFSNELIQYNKEREDKLYQLIAKSQEQLDRLEDSFEDYVVILGKLRDDLYEMKNNFETFKDDMK